MKGIREGNRNGKKIKGGRDGVRKGIRKLDKEWKGKERNGTKRQIDTGKERRGKHESKSDRNKERKQERK